MGDWVLTRKSGTFERNLGPLLDAVPFKVRTGFSLAEWVGEPGKRQLRSLTEKQLNELGLGKYGDRVADDQQKANLQQHLLAAEKWRDTLRWKASHSVTFVLPDLHRMAVWYVPYHSAPDGLEQEGDLSGGIYRTIQNLSDVEGAESVLWKRQHQLAACVANGRFQFTLLATKAPEAALVDLIRPGKKIADRELARGRYGSGW